MKVLILGASGLVGNNPLERALAHPSITEVIAPTRRALSPRTRLRNPVSERLDLLLPQVATWAVDAVMCAMGTTIA
jgi:uncharacterized protein YbjT (DUF2867 family)